MDAIFSGAHPTIYILAGLHFVDCANTCVAHTALTSGSMRLFERQEWIFRSIIPECSQQLPDSCLTSADMAGNIVLKAKDLKILLWRRSKKSIDDILGGYVARSRSAAQ